jgi:hypothetical protein
MMPNGRTGPLVRIKPCVLVGRMFQLSPEGIAGCGCTSECSGPKVLTHCTRMQGTIQFVYERKNRRL